MRPDSYQQFKENVFESKKIENQFLYQLKVSIVNGWNEKIDRHFDENPLTSQEKLLAGERLCRYEKRDGIEKMYGTTLIGGLLTTDFLVLIQQGDGHAVTFDKDGNAYDPVPVDEDCVANVTTSMCDDNAVLKMRHVVFDLNKVSILACFLGTDGVEDSFSSMKSTHVFYSDVIREYFNRTDDQTFSTKFDATLSELSEKGSGDDVSVAAIVHNKIAKELFDTFEKTKTIVICQTEIEKIDNKLNSMFRKCHYLKDKYEQSKKAYENFLLVSQKTKEEKEREAKEIEAEYLAYLEKYKVLEDRKEKVLKEIASLSSMEDLEKA